MVADRHHESTFRSAIVIHRERTNDKLPALRRQSIQNSVPPTAARNAVNLRPNHGSFRVTLFIWPIISRRVGAMLAPFKKPIAAYLMRRRHRFFYPMAGVVWRRFAQCRRSRP
jgi:hypothetical protein